MLSVVAVNKVISKIEELELDASVSETHNFKNSVTMHPIEGGSKITDHAYSEPDTIEIEGFISNTPLREVSAPTVRTGDTANRVNVALDALLRIRNNREVVTVVTGLQVYTNMMLTSLVIPRNRTVGIDTIRFTAQFQRVSFVTSQTVPIANISKDVPNAKNQAAPASDKGSVESPPVDTRPDSLALWWGNLWD